MKSVLNLSFNMKCSLVSFVYTFFSGILLISTPTLHFFYSTTFFKLFDTLFVGYSLGLLSILAAFLLRWWFSLSGWGWCGGFWLGGRRGLRFMCVVMSLWLNKFYSWAVDLLFLNCRVNIIWLTILPILTSITKLTRIIIEGDKNKGNL